MNFYEALKCMNVVSLKLKLDNGSEAAVIVHETLDTPDETSVGEQAFICFDGHQTFVSDTCRSYRQQLRCAAGSAVSPP